MKIQYLGTAAAEAIPAVWCDCPVCRKARVQMGKDFRTRSQVLLDDRLLVDLPPDTYLHMTRFGIPLYKIANLIITHSHQDHFYPEELSMRGPGYAKGISEPLQVYGNDQVVERVKNTAEIEIPRRIVLHEFTEFQPEEIDGFRVIPLLANHDPAEKCLIFSIEKNGKRILYSNDTGEYPEATWNYLEREHLTFDLLSMDATMGLEDTKGYHMGFPNILRVLARMRTDGLITEKTPVIATHFSHNYYIFYEELAQRLKQYGIVPSYDGMTVEI